MLALMGAGCGSQTSVPSNANVNVNPEPSTESQTDQDKAVVTNEDATSSDHQVEVKVEVKPADVKTKATVSTYNVAIQNFAFSQKTLKVKQGDKVIFTNRDSVGHTADADNNAFNSGMLNQNASYTLNTSTLDPGTYAYHCGPHPNMKATLIIE